MSQPVKHKELIALPYQRLNALMCMNGGTDRYQKGGAEMGKKSRLRTDRAVAAGITEKLAALEEMTVAQLRVKYLEVFGQPTRNRNRPYLKKRIAWRIQELAEGGLSDRALARIEELVPHFPERWQAVLQGKNVKLSANTSASSSSRDPRLPKPGTVIMRVHKGVEHKVTVLDDGFEFNGERYQTLSKLAKLITGSQWNGFLFFGLQRRQKGVKA